MNYDNYYCFYTTKRRNCPPQNALFLAYFQTVTLSGWTLSNTSGRKEVSLSMAKTNKAIIVPRICRPELDVPTHQNIGTLISFSILPIISVY